MKNIYIIIAAFVLFSCEKVEDDSDLICTNDCTSVFGYAYTQNNVRLKNVVLKFRYQKNGGPGSLYTRILSKEKTNSTGEYAMSFFIKDEELGAYFDLYPAKNSVTSKVFYPEYYNLFSSINIENRNVSIQRNLYIPTAKKVKIELDNFTLNSNEDYFSFEVILPCGFDLAEVNPDTGNNHNYVNTGVNKYILNKNLNVPNKVFTINLALNELNYIKVIRMKNGIYTQETFPIFVAENTDGIIEFSF